MSDKLIRVPQAEVFGPEYSPNALNRTSRDWSSWAREVRDELHRIDSNEFDEFMGVNVSSSEPVDVGGAVRILGRTSVPGILIVEPAKADSQSTMPAGALAREAIAKDGGHGRCRVRGPVFACDTSGWGTGDVLYVDPAGSNGSLTNVRPDWPHFAQAVGVCRYSDASDGQVEALVDAYQGFSYINEQPVEIDLLSMVPDPLLPGGAVPHIDASGVQFGWSLPAGGPPPLDSGVVAVPVVMPGRGRWTPYTVEVWIEDGAIGTGALVWAIGLACEWAGVGQPPMGFAVRGLAQTLYPVDLANTVQKLTYQLPRPAGGASADALLQLAVWRLSATDPLDTAIVDCQLVGLRVQPSMT